MTAQGLSRERRLEALGLADEATLVALADRVLETLPVEVSRGPQVGLLMVRVEEPSQGAVFNFAEVTVSEAEVTAVGGGRGYAMVMGRRPEQALAAAVLDAALEAGHEAAGDITAVLQGALGREERRQQVRWQQVRPTRVRFEELTP